MAVPFTVSMKVKHLFFDRAKVKKAMDATTHKAMREAAGTIRKIAQQSMRYVSPKSKVYSRPGEPPRARRPHPWVRKFLWFYYDPREKVAVIGPVHISRSTNALHTLEFGGHVSGPNRRRRKRRLGSIGEIRIVGKDAVRVRLTTQGMVNRANDLNKQLYGPDKVSFRLEPRPFMGPALKKEIPQLPRRWAKSVRG